MISMTQPQLPEQIACSRCALRIVRWVRLDCRCWPGLLLFSGSLTAIGPQKQSRLYMRVDVLYNISEGCDKRRDRYP